MLAFYTTLITFSIIALITASYWFYILANKKSTALNNLSLLTLLVLCSIIIAIFGHDFIQLQRGNVQTEAGQCETTYIRGGNSIDSTEVQLNEKNYTIKSGEYKNLPDGIYDCEIKYLPLTKYINEAKISESPITKKP